LRLLGIRDGFRVGWRRFPFVVIRFVVGSLRRLRRVDSDPLGRSFDLKEHDIVRLDDVSHEDPLDSAVV